MKKLLTLLACAALMTVGCNPTVNPGPDPSDSPSADASGEPAPGESEDPSAEPSESVTKADIVGTWEWDGEPVYVFKEDGSYTFTRWGETRTGTWVLNEDKISFTPKGSEPWDVEFKLIGGKAWMVLIFDDSDAEVPFRSFENYRKKGTTVVSEDLGDGRWDAVRDGLPPAEYSADADYTFCMVVKGMGVDLYVPAWGYHIQGNFTLEDGRMKISTDEDHVWWGAYMEGDLNWGSIGWNMSGPPSEESDDPWADTWDYSYGSMNAETFALQSPYTWYSVAELKAMGKEPKEDDPEYKNNPTLFKFMLWETADGVYQNALDLCDFDFCVAPDGKTAFGGAIGLSPCIYKR